MLAAAAAAAAARTSCSQHRLCRSRSASAKQQLQSFSGLDRSKKKLLHTHTGARRHVVAAIAQPRVTFGHKSATAGGGRGGGE